MYTARSLPEGACHLAQENPHYLDDKTLIILNGPHRVANASSWIDRTQASCGAVNTLILDRFYYIYQQNITFISI